MARVKYQPFHRLCIIIILALFYGIQIVCRIFYNMLVLGPSKYLYVKQRDTRPPCMEDPSLGTHKYVHIKTGVKLHYVESGPEDQPLMLFLHGFPECWYSWRHQLREFNKEYRCVAVDMRGYGESDKPPRITDYARYVLVEDIKELILTLGYDNCILVSHDWGGFVAFSFTLKYPDMVSKFISMNIPHPEAFEKLICSAFAQFKRSWYMFFFQLPCLPELFIWSQDYALLHRWFLTGSKVNRFSDDDFEAFKYSLSRQGGVTGPLNYYRAFIRYEKMLHDDQIIKPPSLMIWGKNDLALETILAEMTADYSRDYTLRYVEDTSHWVQQAEPEKVNQHMREWLDSKK